MVGAFTLQQLAQSTGTTVQGDASCLIRTAAAVEQAGPEDISFIRDKKYARHLEASQAGALILNAELAATYAGNCLVSSNPYLTYAQVVTLLYPPEKPAPRIDASAVIATDAEIGDDVYIGPKVVIEAGCQVGVGSVLMAGCVLGANARIGCDNYFHPNVTLGADTQTGDRVFLHSGVVLGADGFGFVPQSTGWYKIPQVGNVVVGDDVEIGANTTVDRAAMGSTRLGNGVKLDNLIQVGHNTEIGEHTAVAACTAIAGSVKIGRHCRIAGTVSIGGHISIADHTTITGTSMVIHSITEPGGVYSSGMPAEANAVWRKNAVRLRQLDQLTRRVNVLEKQLARQQKLAEDKA